MAMYISLGANIQLFLFLEVFVPKNRTDKYGFDQGTIFDL